MPLEIERKFLVAADEAVLAVAAEKDSLVRQGYVVVGRTEVRVREMDGAYTMAVKSGRGLTRTELEYPISAEDGERLFAECGNRVITKRRIHCGRWEFDIYKGVLAGHYPIIGEFEIDSAEDLVLPPLPFGVILQAEVTCDDSYKNQAIAYTAALLVSAAHAIETCATTHGDD